MRTAISMIFVVALLFGCAGTQQCPETTVQPEASNQTPEITVQPEAGSQTAQSQHPIIPEFVLNALKAPEVEKAELSLTVDGQVKKMTAYVAKQAIPDFVHEIADEKLGEGDEDCYEIETYQNGNQVYEVTRLINGKKKEVSVLVSDRSVKYIEEAIDVNALPEPISQAYKTIGGFVVSAAELKEGPGLKLYEVKGTHNGRPATLSFDEQGNRKGLSYEIPAVVKVSVSVE